MKTVKTFSNLAEAGFATSLLEAAGITALLADEQSYSLGYQTPAVGLRVQVDETDFERAQHILAEGSDGSQALQDRKEPPSPERNPIPFRLRAPIWLALLLLIGVISFPCSLLRRKKASRPINRHVKSRPETTTTTASLMSGPLIDLAISSMPNRTPTLTERSTVGGPQFHRSASKPRRAFLTVGQKCPHALDRTRQQTHQPHFARRGEFPHLAIYHGPPIAKARRQRLQHLPPSQLRALLEMRPLRQHFLRQGQHTAALLRHDLDRHAIEIRRIFWNAKRRACLQNGKSCNILGVSELMA